MLTKTSARIHDHFAELTDPRRGEPVYPLINIVVIAICAVVSGSDDFVAIAKYGRTKREWLSQFLDLENGIPSHDRFNAILAALKPAEFEKCLLSWITSLHEITSGQIVAIDGKTLRRSYDKANGKAAIHMVIAWATANNPSGCKKHGCARRFHALFTGLSATFGPLRQIACFVRCGDSRGNRGLPAERRPPPPAFARRLRGRSRIGRRTSR